MSTLPDRFWSKVNKDGPTMPHMTTPCWSWVGAYSLTRQGERRGHIMVGSKRAGTARIEKAARVSYEMHHGPIPFGLLVRHQCDNPNCVNPSHLLAGTVKQNAADMMSRGRGKYVLPLTRGIAPGETNGNARLTEEKVRRIREAYASGRTLHSLGEEFGVQFSCIHKVVSRQSWKHVQSAGNP